MLACHVTRPLTGPAATAATKLEHPAHAFSELVADRVRQLHTCSLYTCVQLESGTMYWW